MQSREGITDTKFHSARWLNMCLCLGVDVTCHDTSTRIFIFFVYLFIFIAMHYRHARFYAFFQHSKHKYACCLGQTMEIGNVQTWLKFIGAENKSPQRQVRVTK